LLANYGYIAVLLLGVLLFAVIIILFPVALRFLKIVPRNPNPVKNSAFECGMETLSRTPPLNVVWRPSARHGFSSTSAIISMPSYF